MFIMKGKYNIARIFLPSEESLDGATREQIQGFLNHPAVTGKPIAIMPDVHFGKGSCVGFTFPMNDYIIPNMVGVDIGCGIYSYNIGKAEIDGNTLWRLDQFIRATIPSGFKIHDRTYDEVADLSEKFSFLLMHLQTISSEIGKQSDWIRYFNSLGTLGGGNHFIEVGMDDSGDYWLTVHSGSRKFGLDICNFYQQKAKDLMGKFFLGDLYKDAEFLPMDLGGNHYLNHMKKAQEFAHLNRLMMMDKVISGFFHQDSLDIDRYYMSVHNYISFDDGIIRKGAVQANKGQRVVIPFNMEDGLILGTGKGNSDWNFSAPHGAGRVLSRNQAKKNLSLDEARKGMEEAGVFTTSLSQETLDEAKGAYKPMELILEMTQDCITVDRLVKPVYNFKAK